MSEIAPASLPVSAVQSDVRVLVMDNDKRHLRQLQKTLRALFGKVEARSTFDELPSDGEFHILITNYDALTPEERRQLLERFGGSATTTRLLIFSEGKYREDLVELFGARSLTNLVAKREETIDFEDLIVTTRKIVTGDIFGLEKYFIWGVSPLVVQVQHAAQKPALVDLASDFARNIGVNDRFVERLCIVADEFVTNAIYNAPTNGAGEPRYASTPRNVKVSLEPHEQVEVKLCCDGRRLGISVGDPFGSLSVDTLLDYLAKCLRGGKDQIDDKAGGAGLGFYYIFEALSHFVVNVHPGKRTEMIGIIDVSGAFKDFHARPKSFNIFMRRE